MGRSTVPWTLHKRALLYDRKDTDYKAYGDALFEAERYADALDFYLTGGVDEGVERIKEWALGEGDYYLLARIAERRPEEVTSAEWRRAGEAAVERGKFAFATWCYDRAGDDERMRSAAEKAGIELPEEEEDEAGETDGEETGEQG